MESVREDLSFHLIAFLAQHVQTLALVGRVTHDVLRADVGVELFGAFRQHRGHSRDPGIRKAHELLIIGIVALDACPGLDVLAGETKIRVPLGHELDVLAGIVADDSSDEVDDRRTTNVLAGLLDHVAGVRHHHGNEARKLIRALESLVELPVIHGQLLGEHLAAVEILLLDQGKVQNERIDRLAVDHDSRVDARISFERLVDRAQLARDVAVSLLRHLETGQLRPIGPHGKDRFRQHLRDSGTEHVIARLESFLAASDERAGVGRGESRDTGGLRLNGIQNSCKLMESKVICHLLIPPFSVL